MEGAWFLLWMSRGDLFHLGAPWKRGRDMLFNTLVAGIVDNALKIINYLFNA